MNSLCNIADNSEIDLIYEGIDINKTCHSTQKVKNPVKIVSVGRLEKDQISLIKTVKLIIDNGVNATFTIYGEESERNNLQNFIEKNNLRNCFFLPGYKDNIHQYLTNHQILVMPSLNEGICLSILDAMVAKLAVVATNVGGIHEIVSNGINGVPIQSPKNIFIAVKELIDNPHINNQYVNNSQETIQNLCINKMLNKTHLLYKSLI